jgi:hypothetical protein
MIVSSHRGADRELSRRTIEWRLRGTPAGVKSNKSLPFPAALGFVCYTF